MNPLQQRKEMKGNLLKARQEVQALSKARRPRSAEELITRVRQTREKIWDEKLASRS